MPGYNEPKPLLDNPHADEYRNMQDDGRRFRVAATAVGGHREGAVVSAKELGEGAQLDRLVKLGAISELSEADVYEYNKSKDTVVSDDNDGLKVPVVQPTGTGPLPPSSLANPPAGVKDGKDKG